MWYLPGTAHTVTMVRGLAGSKRECDYCDVAARDT